MSDFTIPQGATWSIRFPLIDSETGDPVQLSEYDFYADVRSMPNHESELLHSWRSTGTTPNIVTDVNDVILKVTPAESYAWDWRDGWFDLFVVKRSTGEQWPIDSGRITVDRAVTHRVP